MHLGNAIAAHNEWKAMFRLAIARLEILDAAIISADNCCELGQWLYGEGKALFGKLPSHTHCVSTHKIFHREAGTIADAINAKKFVAAGGMLSAQAAFSSASEALAEAVRQLKKEAASSPGFVSLIAKLSK